MKIGFDISQTGNNKAGCGYYADSLILALTTIDNQNKYILYPHFGDSFYDPEAAYSTRIINKANVSRKLIGENSQESIEFWKNLSPHKLNQLGSPDIIHSNNYFCPIGLLQTRIVYALHDLSFMEYPELTTEQNRVVCFKGVFNAATSADFIIAVSAHSKKTFLEFFPHYPQQRIQVVHEASRFIYQNIINQNKPELNLNPAEFWLTVGTLEPRKNLHRLIKGFAQFKNKTKAKFPLVLAGGKGWLQDDPATLIRDLNCANDVQILGYVSDEELSWLYKNCFGFIYPSLYEGFGLPVLEAMELGAAVITSNSSSLPEVAGKAAHFINPLSTQDISMALQKLYIDKDYRISLKSKAITQAKNFSWNKCASEICQIYKQVMKIKKYRDGSF